MLDGLNKVIVQASLDAIEDPNKRVVMNYLAAVPMRPAVYYSTGDDGTGIKVKL